MSCISNFSIEEYFIFVHSCVHHRYTYSRSVTFNEILIFFLLRLGRGKRKMDSSDIPIGKKPRIDQDLSAIEASTMAVITIDEPPMQQDPLRKSSELYKALKQPPIDHKSTISVCKIEKHSTGRKEVGKKDSAIMMQLDSARSSCVIQEDLSQPSTSQAVTASISLDAKDDEQHKKPNVEIVSEKTQKSAVKQHVENKGRMSSDGPKTSDIKEIPIPPGHSSWLTPTSKKQGDATIRGETLSTVQVIDEETRMSAESGSRSQTPARNIPAQGMHSCLILILRGEYRTTIIIVIILYILCYYLKHNLTIE